MGLLSEPNYDEGVWIEGEDALFKLLKETPKRRAKLTRAEREALKDMIADAYNYAFLIAFSDPKFRKRFYPFLLRKMAKIRDLKLKALARQKKVRKTCSVCGRKLINGSCPA